MDGGSGLNILYVDTLDTMHIPWSELRLVSSPIHSMILGMQSYPLGQIDLPITFGDHANFYLEVLTFEVVDFLGSYHAILGRPYYAKFMMIPNYTYLKLKMPGPNDIIIVGSTFSHAYTCHREHYRLATAIINSIELLELRNSVTPVVLDSSNNVAEYEDLINGLCIAIELGATWLHVHGDSELVIDQVMKESSCKSPLMAAYYQEVRKLEDKF
ncbi:uncharacterized protein [Miscanthus floridulus]|uniref:uncharacterized protein n=1 Tax=Miscanthus floridulus TaxID=154761 RepID=UPI003459E020